MTNDTIDTTTPVNKYPTIKEASSYVATMPMQFGVNCVKCGAVKAVRRDVFEKRVAKVYELGGDIKQALDGYVCKKCQKIHGVNLIGGTKGAPSKGSTKVMTSADLC